MKMKQDCIGCILEQSSRVASVIGADDKLRAKLYDAVEVMSREFTLELSPPEEAAGVYANMANIAKMPDLFKEIKKISTARALEFIPYLKDKIESSNDKFLDATKAAVAGNVIDLASQIQFDLAQEVEKVFDIPFGLDDSNDLHTSLASAKKVLYIGDNAGEHIFDKFYIEILKELFPNIIVTYLTRGVPIINDITFSEAIEAGLSEVADVVDSGVNTPGFVKKNVNEKTLNLYENADLIIAKGMGNYETMEGLRNRPIFFLLKVKCEVVAESLGQNVGDIICKKSKH